MIFRSTLLLTLLSISTAFAQSSYYNSTQGQGGTASEAEVVKYFSKYVYEMKKPYMVFHWFSAIGRNPIWSGPISAYDYAGYNYIQNQGVRFFQGYCSQQNPSVNPADCGLISPTTYGTSNMYGPGLYAAQDPVTTASYGGGQNTAVLVQIQLPKGLRIFDAAKDYQAFPQEIINYFQSEQCAGLSRIDSLLRIGNPSYFYGGNLTTDKCKLLVRRLLKDQLRIEGFFYAYGSTSFQGCNGYSPVSQSSETAAIGNYQGPFNQRAFILTSPGKISPKNVKVFNMQTPDDKTDRVTLYSVFKLAGSSFAGSYGNATWKDMTPNDANSNVLDWLKENIMGCKAEVPYGPAQ